MSQNPSLAILIVSLHVIFFHTFWVATISLLKFTSIVASDGLEDWNQKFQQDPEEEC
jgi:hypothetical protein